MVNLDLTIHSNINDIEKKLKEIEGKTWTTTLKVNGADGKLTAFLSNLQQIEAAVKQVKQELKGVLNNPTGDSGGKGSKSLTKTYADLNKMLTTTESSLRSKFSSIGDFVEKNNAIQSKSFQNLKAEFSQCQSTYDTFITKSADLRNKMSNLSGNASDVDYNEFESLRNSMNQLIVDADNLQKRMTEVVKPINRKINNSLAFDKIGNRLTEYFSKYENGIKKNSALYNKWLTLMHKANNGGFASIADANRQFAAFRVECRAAGVEVDSFASKLEKTFGTRIRSALAGYGVMAMQGAVTDILQNVKEFDTALTELKKVTNATDAEYAQFVEDAKARSIELKTSLTDVVSSAADFSRLGYDIPQAEELSKAAIVYSRVGDDVESIDQASSSLISTMQAFQTPASDVMTIVDKLSCPL